LASDVHLTTYNGGIHIGAMEPDVNSSLGISSVTPPAVVSTHSLEDVKNHNTMVNVQSESKMPDGPIISANSHLRDATTNDYNSTVNREMMPKRRVDAAKKSGKSITAIVAEPAKKDKEDEHSSMNPVADANPQLETGGIAPSTEKLPKSLKVAGGVFAIILLTAAGATAFYTRKQKKENQSSFEEVGFDIYEGTNRHNIETAVHISEDVWGEAL
ncbi:hypothetical protein X943_002263, partial [Babesia divergens]